MILDSGDAPFTATTLGTTALSVVRTLQHPTETANKYLCVASFVATQNEVLHELEECTGTTWAVKKQSAAGTITAGKEMLAKGERKGAGMMMIGVLFKDKEQKPEDELANKSLELPKEDLKSTVERIVKGLGSI